MTASEYEARATRDARLVERAKGGDRGAIAELVRCYAGMAQRLASGILGDRAAAEDVAQDAFVRAFDKLESCRDPRVFGGWLASVVVATARNERRRRERADRRDRRWLRTTPQTTDDPASIVIEQLDLEHRRDVLFAALARLGDADREVLTARFVAGLSEVETAAALSMPKGTVKSRTSRALARLRADVEGSAPVDFDTTEEGGSR